MNSNMQKNVSGDLTAKKSNGKAVVSSAEPNSGDLTSRKPSGKAVASSVEPIVRAGFTGVSPVFVSGDPKSKKLNGKAVVSSADPISGDLTVKKPNGKDVDSSAEPIKRAGHTIISPVPVVSGDPKSKQKNGKAVVTSAEAIKRTGNAGCSCADVVSGKLTTKKLKGKAVDSSSIEVLFFKDVKFGPQEGELRFRLIHFWEARNTHTKILIGIEMILIDEQGTVIQGFIQPSRIDAYLPHMIAGSLYRLIKFYGSKSKTMYRVSEQDVTISFSWNSVLSVLENYPVQFLEDRFRFYGYEEFESA
ncbi:BnaUnng05010D, partial [Brassica napus]